MVGLDCLLRFYRPITTTLYIHTNCCTNLMNFLRDNVIPWLLQRHVTYSEATTEANPSNYSFLLSTCPLLFCRWFPSKLAVHGSLNQLVLGIVSQTLSPNVGLVTNSFSGIACHCPKMVLFFFNVKTMFFVGGFPASYCLILYTPED